MVEGRAVGGLNLTFSLMSQKEVWPRYQEKYRNQASAFVDVEPGHDE